MKKITLSMLLSAIMMFGAMIATTTSASACGRTYSTACVIVEPAPVRVIYTAPRCHSDCCGSCAPVCHKVWRWKTIKVWNSRLCCYVYKRVRRYRTVCR